MKTDRHPGCVRLGRLLVKWDVRLSSEAPFIDGGTTVMVDVDDDTGVETVREHFAGPVLRLPGRTYGVTVAWKGARCPNPRHWRPSWLLRQTWWRLRGRPLAPGVGVAIGDYADVTHVTAARPPLAPGLYCTIGDDGERYERP